MSKSEIQFNFFLEKRIVVKGYYMNMFSYLYFFVLHIRICANIHSLGCVELKSVLKLPIFFVLLMPLSPCY